MANTLARLQRRHSSAHFTRQTLAALLVAALIGTGAAVAPAAAATTAEGQLPAQSRSAEASEDPAPPVEGPVPESTGSPAISGDPRVGAELVADAGTWSNASGLGLEWLMDGEVQPVQWRSSHAFGSDSVGGTPFLVPAGAVGKAIGLRVTATNAAGTATSLTVDGGTVLSGVFAESPVPTVSGSGAVGTRLVATPGAWAPNADLTYQWFRNGTAIAGATEAGYTVVADDNGQALLVRVRASRPGYTTLERYSAETVGLVGSFATAPTPAISGSVRVGSKLTVKTGTWPSGAQLAYQWYRGGLAISGATAPQYTPTATDRAKKLQVRVSGTAAGYQRVERYSAEKTVASGAFATAPAPTISGTVRVGNRLTAKPGTWSPAASLTYQWYRNGRSITAATKSTYTPTSADRGQKLSVRVRASKAGFTKLDRLSASATVGYGRIAPTRALTISGTAGYGKTVTVSVGWPAGTKATYQWYLDGKAVKGATSTSLKLGSAYVSRKIQVRATATKSGYGMYRTTSPTLTVAKARMSVKYVPKISGTKKAGFTLTATRGTYSVTPSSYGYRWYRNGVAISGATKSGYRLVSADNGKKITVKVTAMRPYYSSVTATSAAVTIPVPAKTVISQDGTFRVGTQIKPGLYKATGPDDLCYWERLDGFSGSLDDINANYAGVPNTYVRILPSDIGFSTSGCGKWTTVPSTGPGSTKITKDGTYRIGADLKPGTYAGTAGGSGCYWEILSDFTGDFEDIVDNYYGSARTIVEVPAGAAGFAVSGCGTLIRQ